MNKLRAFVRREWLPLALVAVLFVVRLLLLDHLGAEYSIESDDLSYIKSGITLAQTGMLTMHNNLYPSAQIMPGLSAIIAVFYLLFGEGHLFWLALKLLWCAMGAATGWFLYQAVRLFAPRPCAVIAALPLLRPDFLWTDNLILTETPFMLLLTMMIYFTLQMGQTGKTRYYAGCGIAYLLALSFKANIGLYPVFAGVYLLCKRYGFVKLLRQGVILALVLACCLAPWAVRNYKQFGAFIPLTYGAGNPQLLGTYQGIGYPHDETLDYDTNVTQVMRETYAAYFNEDGTIPERYQWYLALEEDGIQARYRMKVWWETHPGSMVLSYLFLKPWRMMNDIFYFEPVWGLSRDLVFHLQHLDTALCCIVLLASLFLKKHRAELWFLTALYLGNVMLYAMTFAYGRYNMTLMPMRFLLIGIGLGAIAQTVQSKLRPPTPKQTEKLSN